MKKIKTMNYKKVLSLIIATLLIFSVSFTNATALTNDTETIENKIVSAWKEYNPTVNIEEFNINENDLETLISNIIDRNSEYFYVNEEFRYSSFSDGKVSDIKFSYLGTHEEIEKKKIAFNKKVDEIISLVDKNWSATEKVLFLHDYIATNNVYDVSVYNDKDVDTPTEIETHTAYGCLVENFSVCQGISRAFLYLSKLLGIEAYSVKSDKMNHEWNMVKIEDNYFHLDITWDAPVVTDSYGKNQVINGFVTHKYFLKSDKQIQSLGHYNWISEKAATNETAFVDGYWIQSSTAFFFLQNKQYFISNNILKCRDISSGEINELYQITDEIWTGSNDKDYYWKGETSKITTDYKHNYIIFSGATSLYLYNINNGSVINTGAIKDKSGYIFGLNYKNDTVNYDLKDIDKDSQIIFQTGKTETISFPDSSILYGDINNDRKTGLTDILLLRKYLANIETEYSETNADVFFDGNINLKDVISLRRIIMNNKLNGEANE